MAPSPQHGSVALVRWRVGPQRVPAQVRSHYKSSRRRHRVQGKGTHPPIVRPGPVLVCKHANILSESIFSWNQLRSELRASFRVVRSDEVTSCDFYNLKQGSMTLQEYLERIMKLCARGPDVANQSIIDAVVHGINLGPC